MNCQLKDITVTARDGRVSHLDQVYIRGSHVRYFIVPDMLRYGKDTRTQDSGTIVCSQTTETRRCSGQGVCAAEVSVWQEVARPSTGPEATAAEPLADKLRRLEGLKERLNETHKLKSHVKTGSRIDSWVRRICRGTTAQSSHQWEDWRKAQDRMQVTERCRKSDTKRNAGHDVWHGRINIAMKITVT